MKKIVIAFVAAATTFAGPAFAQTSGGIQLGSPQFQDRYSNRGACESALAHERNSQRKDASTRGAGYQDLSGSDFNRASLTTTRCEQLPDGGYGVFYYQNGF
jgi:hypothetical protein